MDWYLDSAVAVTELRREIRRYLDRHAEPGSDLESAELVASELLTNAFRHGHGPSWVSLSWSATSPVLQVADLGAGFELEARLPDDRAQPGGRGLFLIDRFATRVDVRARAAGGSIVTAVLPVTRATSASHDPPVTRLNALPALDEALPTGGFARESFLRALVVQLAQAVEVQAGPDVAEAAVAQVGADVGSQMELEYRAAKQLVDRLTPDEIGDCYVRLKHAIDGGFRVDEANAEQIVLVNTRCPFGDVVQRAPALCRMTSSVFGGIAARNSDDGASVLLEERIAVGDPQCRITVRFNARDAALDPWAHRYDKPRG